jgi:NAD(P)-dependent dehydrogenase (short-subunit alcohol dehydrogenase family)
MSFFPHFLYSQWCIEPEVPTQSFSGQTAIVTGSNTGLGLESARHIVGLGAEKLILACRNLDKGEVAKADIEATTGRKGVVEVWQLDLSSYMSVKSFARRVEGLERVDCLLENAGIATSKFKLSEENESTITTNVVSTFLLGFLLLPKLKETANKYNITPRISIVNSALHIMAKLDERKIPGKLFDALNNEKTAKMGDRYNVSKLLVALAVRAFAEEFGPDYPVAINYPAPGFCRSSLANELPSAQVKVMYTMLHARSTEEGSRLLVHAVGAGKDTHGQYIDDAKIKEPSPWVRSVEGKKVQKQFWGEFKEKLEGIEPGLLARV